MQEHFPCYYMCCWNFILESRNPFVWGGVPRKCRHSGEDLWFKLQRQGEEFTRYIYIYMYTCIFFFGRGGIMLFQFTLPPPSEHGQNLCMYPVYYFCFTTSHGVVIWFAYFTFATLKSECYIVHFKWLHCALFWLQNGYTAMIRAVAFQQYEVVRLLCITRPVLKSIPDNVSSRLTDNFMLLSFFLFSYVL